MLFKGLYLSTFSLSGLLNLMSRNFSISSVSSRIEFLSSMSCLGFWYQLSRLALSFFLETILVSGVFFFSETKKSRNLFLMREVSGCCNIPVPRQILLCHRENFFNRPLAEGKCDSRDMSCSYIIPSPRTSSHLNEGPRLQ